MAIVLDGTSGINTPDLESAGPVSGTTGTFSGAVTAASVQAGGVATNIYPLVSATAVTASGTSVDFTGIPSWVKRITVMFGGVSTNGTTDILIRLGTSGGVQTTGYLGASGYTGGTPVTTNPTTSFSVYNDVASDLRHGSLTFSQVSASANLWVCSGVTSYSTRPFTALTSGSVTLSGTLDRIRITTNNGTDNFDAGTINILYEG
jgi:hypothetical protein